ncbi:MAG: hypothetical protein V4469_00910 [Patescibacteria group bacterium]
MLHIADHLPYTHSALKAELEQAEAHLKLVKEALEKFEAAECTFTGELTPKGQKVEFEVVCPQENPAHSQGKAWGNNLARCVNQASEMSGRNGPFCAFLNVDDASIAISKYDFSNLEFQDHEKNGRVCWTKTVRKNIWLT